MPLLAPADLCLLNASFEVMNILAPLDFSDHTFDLVNIGPSGARIPRSAWPTLLHECLRVLRPGGILRLTQTDGAGSTTSPAYERFHRLTVQALHQTGCGFSPDGMTMGLTPVLSRLLANAGCHSIASTASVLDFSADSPAHPTLVHDTTMMYPMRQSLLTATGLLAPDEIMTLYQQMLLEMLSDDFCGIWFFLTAWGTKP